MKNTLLEVTQSLELTQTELSAACEEILSLKARCDEYDGLQSHVQSMPLRQAQLEKKSLIKKPTQEEKTLL